MIHKIVCILAVVSAALLGEQASAIPTIEWHSLCKNPNTTPVEMVAALEAGADVNARTEGGATPLMLAAINNTNPEVVSTLIQAGAAVNARSVTGLTALMYAGGNNTNPEVVSTLIQAGAAVNARTEDGPTSSMTGLTALMLAAINNTNPEVVSTLIQAGAAVNARSVTGLTALMFAATSNTNPEVASTLIQAGADVNAMDQEGWSPLMFAARVDTPEVISVLLKAGAIVNDLDEQGSTALRYAVEKNTNHEVVSRLLDAGAFVDTKVSGISSRMRKNFDKVLADANARWKERKPSFGGNLLRAVFGSGSYTPSADEIVAKTQGQPTALMHAITIKKDPKLVSLLLKAGADVEAEWNWRHSEIHVTQWDAYGNARATGTGVAAGGLVGWTPLRLALWHDAKSEVVLELLKAGADVNAICDERGFRSSATPLMLAARYSTDPEVISILLEAGADANATDTWDRRALDFAEENQAHKYTSRWVLNDATKFLCAEVEYDSTPTALDPRREQSNLENDINVRTENGLTPLMIEVSKSATPPELVSELLEAGALVNAKDKFGWTPLMFAAKYNTNPEVLSTLIRGGAHVNLGFDWVEQGYRSPSKTYKHHVRSYRPLMLAARYNNSGVVSVLLDAGANPNAKRSGDDHPLMQAARYSGDPGVVTALINGGSDPNAWNECGFADFPTTPLMHAAEYNSNPEVLLAIIRGGGDVNASSERGNTALLEAARYNNAEVVLALLDAGADMTARYWDDSVLDRAKENAKLKGTEAYWRINDAAYE